jgi:hypothetical protein
VWLLFPDFLESLENLGSQITRALNLDSIGVGKFTKVADEKYNRIGDLTASAAVGRQQASSVCRD